MPSLPINKVVISLPTSQPATVANSHRKTKANTKPNIYPNSAFSLTIPRRIADKWTYIYRGADFLWARGQLLLTIQRSCGKSIVLSALL